MNPFLALWVASEALARHPLRPRSRWGAAWALSRARLALSRSPAEVSVEFPNGTRLHFPARMTGGVHFLTIGLCEFPEMSFVAHYLRPGDLFADVGANVGSYTVLASGVAGARAMAFEPSPTTFESLRRNLLANGLTDRARAVNSAVGRAPGRLRLTNEAGTENRVLPAGQSGDGIEVPVTTLDDALAGEAPAVMKIDVEGFESEVLAGATRTLAQPNLLAMIIERGGNATAYGTDEDALHRSLRAAGWSPWAYDPLTRRLSALGADATGNLIYLREPDRVADRLKDAPAFTFAGRRI